jgi:hypothetical protein
MAYKTLQGYSKYIFLSDGRIWSKSRRHFLKPSVNAAGYPQIPFVRDDGKRKSQLFHILIATSFIPNPNNYPIVNHKDNDRTNCHYLNLEWCTQGHNLKHAYKTGQKKWTVGNSKLKVWQVKAIRLFADYEFYSLAQIANFYDVSKSCVKNIKYRQIWRNVA